MAGSGAGRLAGTGRETGTRVRIGDSAISSSRVGRTAISLRSAGAVARWGGGFMIKEEIGDEWWWAWWA